MTNSPELTQRDQSAHVDAIGWFFAALSFLIIAVVGILAYNDNSSGVAITIQRPAIGQSG